jgi:hypothetical protein
MRAGEDYDVYFSDFNLYSLSPATVDVNTDQEYKLFDPFILMAMLCHVCDVLHGKTVSPSRRKRVFLENCGFYSRCTLKTWSSPDSYLVDELAY